MSEPVAQPAEALRARPRKSRVTKPLALLALSVALAAPLALVAVDGVAHAPQAQAAVAPVEAPAASPQEFAVASELNNSASEERLQFSATSAGEIEEAKAEEERVAADAAASTVSGVSGQAASAGELSAASFAPAPAGNYGSAIADLAVQYVGVPYVFAGSDPSGWDCSGFTKWVVQQVTGVTLPHGTNSQAALMTWIPASEAQPGDFWFRPNYDGSDGYGHVGIYLGDGLIVHAPQEGEYTRIQTPWTEGVFYRFN